MASTEAHVPIHVSVQSELPPSPTLTNPDMILPSEQHESFPSLVVRSSSPADNNTSPSTSDGPHPSTRSRADSDSHAEVGVATAVTLPMLVRGHVATRITSMSAASIYNGYEHGAPLSDIGEEVEETPTRSRSSSLERPLSATLQGRQLRHKKRSSNLSSSSGGSDTNTQWDQFDTSHLMSDRVAADIAEARDAVEHNSDAESRRNSKEVEEELAVLNDRAEKILANARKRLSSMEDNLTKARHSILLSPRSIPNMHELGHQPAGGLYRSISQSGQGRRTKGLFPTAKALQHIRSGSEMGASTGLKRLSGVPEPRSASAMDFSPARYGVGFITSELKPSPPMKILTHSPSSSRSYNSPLRVLTEEHDLQTPSTVRTSPDSAIPGTGAFQPTRGLGIHASAAKGQEDLSQVPYESSESPSSLNRSSSQASTRSARDLRDQMSEMKTRIADLRNKAQVDSLRRRSLQSLRTPSPFLNANVNGHGAEGWYTGAGPSNYQQQSTTPTTPPEASPWRSASAQGHERKDSALESLVDPPPQPIRVDEPEDQPQEESIPITPMAGRFLNVADITPVHPSSARTDRNTPNIVSRTVNVHSSTQDDDVDSVVPSIEDEPTEEELDTSDDDGAVATNEEEQIYLNEVLEESLHDIEPEVPAVPGEYLIGDELVEITAEEPECHEDRLDAFDYENMFLHSAMGTYRGDEQSDESNESDDESLVTSREEMPTPVAGLGYADDDGDTVSGEEREDYSAEEGTPGPAVQTRSDSQPSSPTSSRSTYSPARRPMWSQTSSPIQARSPQHRKINAGVNLTPPKPWLNVARSRSMETVSTVASYQTAMEDGRDENDDDDDDEDFHDEILNWGNSPDSQTANNKAQHYATSHGVSSKAQNVLGWPTPPLTQHTHSRTSSQMRNHTSSSNGHYRSPSGSSIRSGAGPSPLSGVQYNSYPFPVSAPVQPPPNQPLPPPPVQAPPPLAAAAVTHQANTEILMESLIKLADPEFSIESTGRSNFADIDKELVLGLLRAVGGVCDGVLRAQHGRRVSTVKELRARLVDAKDVLLGPNQEPEGLEEILEGDEEES